ncbi:MAG TPA: acyltransferase family protein [Gaiellaceae bacterium]|nr:acyltransferase family protein [Gaiellaceae bacterium]
MEGVRERAPRLSYRPGLDGLRALAVTGVFLYHARLDWLPGGFLGVDLFFVLSGYLITSLLLVEWESRHVIDLRRFWLRRARRLFPAVVVVVLVSLILAAVFARDDLTRTRGDALSAIFYYTNWHEIIASHSYFAQVGRPSLLQNLWSLAVEEQFYVVWPLLLVAGLVLLGRRRFALVAAAGIAASAAEMWLLYNPEDPSRVYYGTDTRAQLLLMGILLALLWPYVERIGRWLPLLELAGVSALVATIVLFREMEDFNPTLYRGGDLAAAFCFVVLIAAVAHQESRIGRAIGWTPLRWIGARSYGMYLWHFPIIELTRPGVDVSWTGPQLVVVQAALVVIAAELSYHFVEQPIRTGRLQRRLAERPRRRLYALAATAAVAAALGTLFATPAPASSVAAEFVTPFRVHPGRLPRNLEPPGRKSTPPPPATNGPLPPHVFALGDSVMLGCSSELEQSLHGHVRIDAVVGRQIDDAIKVLVHRRNHHKLPPAVIVQVGDNGPTWYDDLVRLRHALGSVPDVVVVNVRVDRSWESEVNTALAAFVRAWPAAHLADWYGSSKDSDLSDGVHPWPYACTTYAHVVTQALLGTS